MFIYRFGVTTPSLLFMIGFNETFYSKTDLGHSDFRSYVFILLLETLYSNYEILSYTGYAQCR